MPQNRIEEKTATPDGLHTITLENRKKCILSGIEKILSASTSCVTLNSVDGKIDIVGSDIKITEFSEKDNLLILDGSFDSLKYIGKKVPLLKRLFK